MAPTTVADVFSKAQVSFGAHKKAAAVLHRLRVASPDSFDDEFFACVACVLEVYKREPAAERIVEFVVEFATQSSEDEAFDEAFMQSLCMRLLRLAHAKDKAVRFRVAQLVCRMLNSMAEDAEVSDDLFEAVEEAMLSRCRDKVPLVRAWALKGLFRLQDPSQPGDAITAELLRLMCEDNAKEVRMAAISTVAPSKHAIRAIMLRTRDSCAEVRLHALGVLRDKVEMRWLSISQRVNLLEGALLDRTPSVAAACAEMLAGGWLRKGCDNDVLALLRALDAVAHERVPNERAMHERVAQLALDVLLARDAATRDLVGAAAKKHWAEDGHERQPESAICLRAHLAYLAAAPGSRRAGGEPDTAALDAAAPELPEMCDALRKAADACESSAGEKEKVAATCVVSALARAAAHCDMTNEHGRSALETLSVELLKSLGTSDEALAPLFDALEAACVGEKASFQRQVTEVISEVEDPLEGAEVTDAAEADARLEREQASMFTQARLGEIKIEVAAKLAEEEEEEAAVLQAEAKELMAKLAELDRAGKESPEVALAREARCLRLSALLLQAPTMALSELEASQLGQRFVPSLQSPHVELRELGVKCLGLYCHASARSAKSFFPLFAKAMQHDQPRVQLAALRAVCDLLLMHSPAEVIPLESAEAAATRSPAAAEAAAAAEKEATDAAAKAVEAGVPLVRSEDAYSIEVSKLLIPMLQTATGSLRVNAALGLAKLMHAGALKSTSLLAQLLLVYFDNTVEADSDPQAKKLAAELSQQLSLFFAASGKAAGVAAALLPAARTVFAAADGSREAAISVDSVIGFVLGLADDAAEPSSKSADAASPSSHMQLCAAFSCEALLNLSGAEAKVLPRAFAQMALPASAGQPANRPLLVALSGLLDELMEGVEDKTAAKGVERMRARVGEILGTAGADKDKDGEHNDSPTAKGMVAAHKALLSADKRDASARKALAEAADEVDEAEPAPRRPSKAAPKGDAAAAAPARRKLAKSKAVGLTPSKGGADGENANANAIY